MNPLKAGSELMCFRKVGTGGDWPGQSPPVLLYDDGGFQVDIK